MPTTEAGRALLADYMVDDESGMETAPDNIAERIAAIEAEARAAVIAQHISAIEAEARATAGHRSDDEHDCFLMNCKGLRHDMEQARSFALNAEAEIERLREVIETVRVWTEKTGHHSWSYELEDALAAAPKKVPA